VGLKLRRIFNDRFQVGQEILAGIEYLVWGARSAFFIDLAFIGLPLWCPEPRLVRIDGMDFSHRPAVTGKDHNLSIAFDRRDLCRSKDEFPRLGW